MSLKLDKIILKGYKSFDNTDHVLPLRKDVTVLIGANGVGKSNVVSFFQMLSYVMMNQLQAYVSQHGYANSFLYLGTKKTDRLTANLHFVDDSGYGHDDYSFTLAYATNGALIFMNEEIEYYKEGKDAPYKKTLAVGERESLLYKATQQGAQKQITRFIYTLLRGCQYFQFHDTTFESYIRQPSLISNNRFLRHDGSNLAAYLYSIKKAADGEPYYRRIVKMIKTVLPQFDDFVMEPMVNNENSINLDWRGEDFQYIYGAHQLSDGSLRFMALATLLMQPPSRMPSIIVLDEPELGLHPAAIEVLATMVRNASRYSQVVIATQSPSIVDRFDTENIVVMEREHNSSQFKTLDPEMLKDWLEKYNYSLSQLWDKNIIGGQPS